MASIVAEIEKAVQNKYLSEELNIETKLHHLASSEEGGSNHSSRSGSLDPHNRVESEQKDPEKERNRENQAALKRNKDLLKETDLVVARYRSRSLYSPVDGHLQACKLTYLKRLKELKHREQIRRFRTPPHLESVNYTGVAEHSTSAAGISRATGPTGILKSSTRPSAYLVTDTPIPFPRTASESARKSMCDSEASGNRGAQSTPASAGLFRSSGEPLTGGLQGRYRQVKSTPGSAGASRGSAGAGAKEPESSRHLVSKPV